MTSFSLKLINLNYIFDKNPSFSVRALLPFFILFALMFAAGMVIPFILRRRYKNAPPYEKLSGKILNSLVTFSLIGFILLFFNWQAIPYLSSRALILILYLIFLIWLVFLVSYIQRGFRSEIAIWQNHLRKMKYIPQKRR